MTTFKEILKVPSAALQAMIDGLEAQSKRSDFKINMSTFGSYNNGICFGCAATCTVQQVIGINFNAATIGVDSIYTRSNTLHLDNDLDLHIFENAIDRARKGAFNSLFIYFEVLKKIPHQFLIQNSDYFMNSDNWKSKIPLFQQLIKDLQAKGL